MWKKVKITAPYCPVYARPLLIFVRPNFRPVGNGDCYISACRSQAPLCGMQSKPKCRRKIKCILAFPHTRRYMDEVVHQFAVLKGYFHEMFISSFYEFSIFQPLFTELHYFSIFGESTEKLNLTHWLKWCNTLKLKGQSHGYLFSEFRL
jgi:hypothetical protein